MRRREFITAIAGSAAAWPLVARAQQAAMPVIGYLSGVGRNDRPNLDEAFRRGLTETEIVEGRNVVIEYRWADGHYDRLSAMAVDLVRLHVAVIAAVPFPAARAAKEATSDIPIVFEAGVDPIRAGFVASLNRPGGNVTGIFNLSLGLVARFVPNAGLIAVLINPANPNAEMVMSEAQGTQAQLGITIEILRASTPGEVDAAFARSVELKAGALVVGAEPFLRTARGQKIAYVVDLAYDEQNVEKIVALARDADQLFIEAPFLDVDANIAAERWHLTARQAGDIAKRAGVRRLFPFRFSARYRDRTEELTREAQEAFSVSESPELPD
jgi:putative ABC transport system substrate-binding protein